MSSADERPADAEALDAGPFDAWLRATQEAIRSGTEARVPCGTCTACCTSSLFIHVAPDEQRALAAIPPELLFPAPGQPPGTQVMGYDEQGHCPMFDGQRCTIYEARPRTCRTFDCRLLSATGTPAGGAAQELITLQSRRWRFRGGSAASARQARALRSAADFLQQHPECVPPGTPRTATSLAAQALRVADFFQCPDGDGGASSAPPEETQVARVRAALAAS